MPKKTKSEKEKLCSIELAGENTPGQSDQAIIKPEIIELGVITLYLNQLKKRPELLKPIHLQCIGSWYYHKYPTRTWFHSNHKYADDLLNVKAGEPIDLWLKLANLIASLPTHGKLSSKILRVYNSAFGTYGPKNNLENLTVIPYVECSNNPGVKTSRQLSAEIKANINKCKNSISKDIATQAKPLLSGLFTLNEEKTNEEKTAYLNSRSP